MMMIIIIIIIICLQTTSRQINICAAAKGKPVQAANQESNMISMTDKILQGGYIGLLMEQIRNSQEDQQSISFQVYNTIHSDPLCTLVCHTSYTYYYDVISVQLLGKI